MPHLVSPLFSRDAQTGNTNLQTRQPSGSDVSTLAHIADLASSALLAFLAERQIVAVRISELVDDYLVEDVDEGKSVAPITLEGLELAACKGIALAHYALALIHASDEEDEWEGAGRDY